jgi:integrase
VLSAIDAERRCITLRATTTKSGKSRTIPPRQELLDELLALRPIHQRARRRVVQPNDRIFVTPDGANHDHATTGMRRVFRRVLERAGIVRIDKQGKCIDIHGLRGTCATRMARNRVPLAITQRLLGHSTPTMTMKHYVHLDVEDLREAVESARPAAARAATGAQEKSA